MNKMLKRTTMLLTAGTLTLAAGCANDTQNGALIGAGVGALAGGIIGNNVGGGHHALGGAAIGAAGGALAGGLIGNVSDQQKKEKEQYYDRGRYDAERDARSYDRPYDNGNAGRGYYDR
ncbi:MAG: YMGG-like glycine zipper-containing protein [Tepidisphaeraceae bacterium]